MVFTRLFEILTLNTRVIKILQQLNQYNNYLLDYELLWTHYFVIY